MKKDFDICVITAANERQAHGYRMQLEWRKKQGLLPHTDFRVIADPDGKRIGSGGSTFNVLARLYEELGGAVKGKRILILHSGGDSRRLPAYSIVGKLFAPLPSRDHYALFDAMLDNYATLPVQSAGQVIIASGDVLLNFEPELVHFAESGVTGVAYPEAAEKGKYFGVYVVREPQNNVSRVDNVLQKPGLELLDENEAIDFTGRVWIDTGILNLAADAVSAFLACEHLIDLSQKAEINFNIYHEILYAMAGKIDIPDGDQLRKVPLSVSCLPYCGFYHVGRSKELLQNFYSLTHAASIYKFQNGTRSNVGDGDPVKQAWVFNTVLETDKMQVRRPSLIESCFLNGPVQLDGENILTNMPPAVSSIHLNKGCCLSLFPIDENDWAAILYGINDQFKGEPATLLNKPIAQFLRDNGFRDEHVWEDETDYGNPWTAKVFPVSDSPEQAVHLALELQNSNEKTVEGPSRRASMKDILERADHSRLLAFHADVQRFAAIHTLSPGSLSVIDEYKLKSWVRNEDDRRTLVAQLRTMVEEQKDPLFQARANYMAASLVGSDEAGEFYDAAFAAVRDGVAKGLEHLPPSIENPRLAVQADQVTWVMLPARFDFAGGWTDTPPVCLERGGCVLNASVILNGQYPIQVIGKVRPGDYTIGINSIDLAKRETITTFEELCDFRNPADWLSLPKAAFVAAGLIPQTGIDSLAGFLKQLGGGIDLTLFSALPAGSGLGTSSILGAGVIAALSRMVGVDMPRDELYVRTSYMEQLMTTGGGWQDHIGGVAGGVKLITTRRGYDQTPTISWTSTHFADEANRRFLLYYTGIQRLAKNLLRQVVGRFLGRQPLALATLDEMAILAQQMKEDLDHRRIDDFGRKLRRSWQLNKTLDAGQTTKEIEALLALIDDHMLGAKLLGAGGGGFLFIVARDETSAAKIRREFLDHPPNERARFFDFNIDPGGMRISVL